MTALEARVEALERRVRDLEQIRTRRKTFVVEEIPLRTYRAQDWKLREIPASMRADDLAKRAKELKRDMESTFRLGQGAPDDEWCSECATHHSGVCG